MPLLVFSHHCVHRIGVLCTRRDKCKKRAAEEDRRRVLTVWAAELGDGLHEALVQVGRPPQPRLGVPRQHHRRGGGAVPRPLHPVEHAAADP
jgi:hypothetical protein